MPTEVLLTLGKFCKYAGLSPATARRYADASYVDCIKDSTGRRLFPERAIEQARSRKAANAMGAA